MCVSMECVSLCGCMDDMCVQCLCVFLCVSVWILVCVVFVCMFVVLVCSVLAVFFSGGAQP